MISQDAATLIKALALAKVKDYDVQCHGLHVEYIRERYEGDIFPKRSRLQRDTCCGIHSSLRLPPK